MPSWSGNSRCGQRPGGVVARAERTVVSTSGPGPCPRFRGRIGIRDRSARRSGDRVTAHSWSTLGCRWEEEDFCSNDWCYEVPAGGLSPGLAPEAVARRELLEEVGGTASELRHVGQFYTSNGISNEVAHVYLARGVELGDDHREPTELMDVQLVPTEEALRMAREGEITDGPSALALLWCEPFLIQIS